MNPLPPVRKMLRPAYHSAIGLFSFAICLQLWWNKVVYGRSCKFSKLIWMLVNILHQFGNFNVEQYLITGILFVEASSFEIPLKNTS